MKALKCAEPSALVLASHAPAAMLRGYWMNSFILLCVSGRRLVGAVEN